MTDSLFFVQDALLQVMHRVSSHLGYPTSGSAGGKTLNEFPKGRDYMQNTGSCTKQLVTATVPFPVLS